MALGWLVRDAGALSLLTPYAIYLICFYSVPPEPQCDECDAVSERNAHSLTEDRWRGYLDTGRREGVGNERAREEARSCSCVRGGLSCGGTSEEGDPRPGWICACIAHAVYMQVRAH